MPCGSYSDGPVTAGTYHLLPPLQDRIDTIQQAISRPIEAVTDCLPPALVDCLLDSALEPVLDAAVERGRQAARRKKNARDATEVAKALLTVTVCDPACGSGSLLVAAARRIARRVAEAREGNQSPDALQRALREVVGSCVYGVDVSGEAVERAKDRLRVAADVPGMTPPFLDAISGRAMP